MSPHLPQYILGYPVRVLIDESMTASGIHVPYRIREILGKLLDEVRGKNAVFPAPKNLEFTPQR